MAEFRARYFGRCATGGDDIAPGERITYTVDQRTRHVGCPDDDTIPTDRPGRPHRFEGTDVDAMGY